MPKEFSDRRDPDPKCMCVTDLLGGKPSTMNTVIEYKTYITRRQHVTSRVSSRLRGVSTRWFYYLHISEYNLTGEVDVQVYL